MTIKGFEISVKQTLFLAIYYGFAHYLPDSYSFVWGSLSEKCHFSRFNPWQSIAEGRLLSKRTTFRTSWGGEVIKF